MLVFIETELIYYKPQSGQPITSPDSKSIGYSRLGIDSKCGMTEAK